MLEALADAVTFENVVRNHARPFEAVHGSGQCVVAAGFEQDMSGGALQPVKEEHEVGTAAEEELKREEPQPM